MSTEEPKTYTTTDVNLSAALSLLGYDLVEIDTSNPRRWLFIFDYDKNIANDEREYWSGVMTVPAVHYAHRLRDIKTRIHNS